jgi:MYXO-CTERM domain-containing protein
MSTASETPRELHEIEADIARTRASLNRKIQQIEQRLSPSEQLARVKSSINPQRFDPRPYPEWIAVGAIALGSLLALAGWRRSRNGAASDDDLTDVVLFEVCDDDMAVL